MRLRSLLWKDQQDVFITPVTNFAIDDIAISDINNLFCEFRIILTKTMEKNSEYNENGYDEYVAETTTPWKKCQFKAINRSS